MRLIDADEVLDMMNGQMDMQDLYLPIHFKELVIDQLPTAYDVDKVVAELEKARAQIYRADGSIMCEKRHIEIDRAIQIVKGGGVDGD